MEAGLAQSVQQTRYWLDGPVIESQWGGRFSAPVQTSPGGHPTYYKMGTVSFPGGKAAGGVALTTHTPTSNEVEGRVELYIYSPSGPLWPVIG